MHELGPISISNAIDLEMGSNWASRVPLKSALPKTDGPRRRLSAHTPPFPLVAALSGLSSSSAAACCRKHFSNSMFPVDRKRRRVMPTVAAETICQRQDNDGPSTSSMVGSDRSLAIGNAKRQNQPMVLRGVIACFSGFSLEVKDRYHEAVVGLGGEYVRVKSRLVRFEAFERGITYTSLSTFVLHSAGTLENSTFP
jgi:hypothetical protein